VAAVGKLVLKKTGKRQLFTKGETIHKRIQTKHRKNKMRKQTKSIKNIR
jgi:hypothetical protein